jgi:hypothetical protein
VARPVSSIDIAQKRGGNIKFQKAFVMQNLFKKIFRKKLHGEKKQIIFPYKNLNGKSVGQDMNFSNFNARTYNELCINSYRGEENDGLWAEEVENRIDAYDQGKLNSIAFEKLIHKYR